MSHDLTIGDAVIGTHLPSMGVFLGYGGQDDYGWFLDYDRAAIILCPVWFYEFCTFPIECELCGMPLDPDALIYSPVCPDCDDELASNHYG